MSDTNPTPQRRARSEGLSDAACRNATCPTDKARVRLYDQNGLYLEVAPSGSKRWFWKYKAGGKEYRVALGGYPANSLKAARAQRDTLKAQRANGVDPVQARKVSKLRSAIATEDTFKAVALQWLAQQVHTWSATYAARVLVWLEKDLFPQIGGVPMQDITSAQLLAAVKLVEKRGALETAHRVLQTAGAVWEFWLALATEEQKRAGNIASRLHKQLKAPTSTHFPAITKPEPFGELLRAMRQYRGGIVVKTALLLAPLLYQRPGNLRSMEWSELDLDRALWTIPSAKMKRKVEDKENGEEHTVPLPRQAVELLRELQPITGRGMYVFPSERQRDKCISENSVRTALYALGYGKEQSWHGFRASARTMLIDELDMDPLAVEANLAHTVKDTNGRSYNRTNYLRQRAVMAQRWADYLEWLETGERSGKVVPLRAA